MRLNEHVQIVGQKVILVPYEAKHVERYNQWMQSKELQELTRSEPLSVEQEYEMQIKWRDHEDKCTFLIVDRARFEQSGDEIDSLVGDTNLFLMIHADDQSAEAEIMIAEPQARGKHFGWEAMLLLLAYGQFQIGLTRFEVKIGIDNARSIGMFGRMQFVETSRSAVFEEVTMERQCTPEWLEWLRSNLEYEIKEYK